MDKNKTDITNKRRIRDNIVITSAVNQTNVINAEATSQMIQAYNGVRYDSLGNDLNHLGKSLKGISRHKINPDYKTQNINQQAGFSAELLTEAKANAKKILAGDNTRIRTADGLGKTNDQISDLYKVDKKGNILGSDMSQSKFLNNTKKPHESYKKPVSKFINDKKWDKYEETNLTIPSDQYEDAKRYAKELRDKYLKQAEKAKTPEARQQALNKVRKAELLDKKLVNSDVTSDEAIQARLNPEKYVAKKTVKDIHDSSFKMAKSAAIVSGSISIAKNTYDVVCKDKPVSEAVFDATKETTEATVKAYGVHTAANTLTIAMKNSTNKLVRRVGATNAPLSIAVGTTEVFKSIKKYAKNEIDESELVVEIGEKGVCSVVSSYCAAVGTVAMPGIGTVAGGMIGYAVSGMIYQASMQVLEEGKLSIKRRLEVENVCRIAIDEMDKYSVSVLNEAKQRQNIRDNNYKEFFKGIEKSLYEQDINEYFNAIDNLSDYLKIKNEFSTFEEFDEFMNDDKKILKL